MTRMGKEEINKERQADKQTITEGWTTNAVDDNDSDRKGETGKNRYNAHGENIIEFKGRINKRVLNNECSVNVKPGRVRTMITIQCQCSQWGCEEEKV